MQKIPAFVGAALLCLSLTHVQGQSADSVADKIIRFPARLFSHIRSRTADLDRQVTQQTGKMLNGMAKREAQMEGRLSRVDSVGTARLFSSSQREYAALLQRLRTDSGTRSRPVSGEYQPNVDSLQGSLSFFKQDPHWLGAVEPNSSTGVFSQLRGAAASLQAVQGRLQVAAEAKAFVQQRRQQISQYIAQHANVQSLLNKPYTAMNQEVYYYSQRLQRYRDMLNSPDRLEKQAMARLSSLPAFQSFMKNNSQLIGLFGVPGSGGGAPGGQPFSGLQTRAQIAQQVQGQIGAGGPSGLDALQSKVQSAQQQLNTYKGKISQLGAGATPADIPDFRPNDQKTKTLWHRLEYGANFQTTHTNYYYPIVTDFGLSLGYRLGRGRVIGVGGAFKMGWGSGINHIALSSQGVGLRSFLQMPLKGSFSAMGAFEYNYTTPYASYQQLKQLQYWTKSGLIGVTKTISLKSRLFKKTQLQLLWDFLSYQAVPKTQPLLFRIAYSFN